MGILVISSLLFGMGLGQIFKCCVLLPSILVTAVVVIVSHMQTHNSLLGSFLQFGALTIALQIGYCAGLTGRYFFRSTPIIDETVARSANSP